MFRKTSLAIAVVAALGAQACGTETGLLIEVTRARAAEGLSDIDAIEVFVGTDSNPGADVFLPDPDDLTVELSAGRDILDQPVRVLLHVGDFRQQTVADTDVILAVVARRGGQEVGWGALPEPVRFVDGEVRKYSVTLDRDRDVNTDGGCINIVSGTSIIQIGADNDKDCDGDLADVDCDDGDPTVGPSQGEKCGNSKDDDCDDSVDEVEDVDGDMVTNCDGDCNDHDPKVAPGRDEVCDGVDNNCDGQCDEGFDDLDGDGYLAACASVRRADGTCRDVRPDFPDCADGNKDIHPERDDPCDGVDNNCNYLCDDDPIPEEFDPDRDGFATCITDGGSQVNVAVGPGLRCDTTKIDCGPEDPLVYPGAPELCDGKDNDCDAETLFVDTASCTVATEDCLLGESECDDNQDETTVDQGPIGQCVAINGVAPLDPDVCVAAEGCDGADSFVCSLTEASPDVVHCKLYFTPTGDGLVPCPNRTVAVPTYGSGAVCFWTIVQVLGNYNMFWLGQAELSIESCDAVLGIENVTPPVTVGRVFVNGASDDGLDPTLMELDIEPEIRLECPEHGFECESPWQAGP